jgi:hypothetical protein
MTFFQKSTHIILVCHDQLKITFKNIFPLKSIRETTITIILKNVLSWISIFSTRLLYLTDTLK